MLFVKYKRFVNFNLKTFSSKQNLCEFCIKQKQQAIDNQK